MPLPSSVSRTKPWLQWVFFAWASVCVVVVSLLMASHLLTLPVPKATPLTVLSARGSGWRVVHVVAKACGCSQRVLASLLERGPTTGFAERVLFIGDDPATEQRLRATGFDFERVTAASLEATYDIRGAPLLVVIDPRNEVIYSGGYSSTQGGPLRDALVLAEARVGRTVEPMPYFGCAVTPALQKQLDPLSLKYP